MANLSFSKVANVGSTGLVTGRIYFETSTGLIKVATSATTSDIFGGVRSANYSEEDKLLTIVNQLGQTITVDLSDVASADSVTTELAKKLNIGTSADASTVQSYYGLKKYTDEAKSAAISEANSYTDEKIEEIPAAVVYKGDGTTITQSGTDTVTFTVGTIAQSKVSGLEGTLAGKANAVHTHVKSDITDFDEADYATAAQGTKADTAIQTVRATNTGTNISIAAAKSGTTINLTPTLTTSTVTSGGAGLVVASDVKQYITSQLNAAQVSALKYKGSCTYAELPEDATQGDVWNVTDAHGNVPAGTNYAWDGEAWDPLAGAVDLSPYLTSVNASATYATKTELTSGLEGKADIVHTHAISDVTNLQSTLDSKVPNTRTVNGKALSSNVTIGGADIIVGGNGDHKADSVATAIEELEDLIGSKSDTTYTFANGTSGTFTVTPSNGSAQTVSIGKPATAVTADKVAHSMTISLNGTAQTAFTGAADVAFNITAANVGADPAGSANTALTQAKSYTDSKLTWVVFE